MERPSGCQFQDRCEYTWEECRTDKPVLVDFQAGHAVRCHLYRQVPLLVPRKNPALNSPRGLFEGRHQADDALLRVDALRVVFRSKSAWFAKAVRDIVGVADVSLKLPSGGTVAVVGESGCGKSTLAKAIMGLLPIASGAVTYAGSVPPGHNAFRRDVQPVLKKLCVDCHGPEKQKGDLRLDTLNPD